MEHNVGRVEVVAEGGIGAEQRKQAGVLVLEEKVAVKEAPEEEEAGKEKLTVDLGVRGVFLFCSIFKALVLVLVLVLWRWWRWFLPLKGIKVHKEDIVVVNEKCTNATKQTGEAKG